MAAACCIAGVAIVGTVASFAQSKPRVAFEVASVRMISGDGGLSQFSQTLTDTRVDITRPLSSVLFTAFGVDYYLWETMDAPVVDKTGLDGVYQFTLALPRSAMTARLILQATSLRRGTNLTGNDAAPEAAAFKALEGLGLRLERRRIPVEVVVVDTISRTPTEN